MSIYCTLGELQLPKDGEWSDYAGWITVWIQAVPNHIGCPKCGYETDPYASFLPPWNGCEACGTAKEKWRAVFIVTDDDEKGTERSGQEYKTFLMNLSSGAWKKIPFSKLHDEVCDKLRERWAAQPAEVLEAARMDAKSRRIQKMDVGMMIVRG